MLVTLLTDFGNVDYFVGAMKGALLSVSPEARLVDITHEIPPQDVRAGAFTLMAVYQSFPPETIHVAVVDPGVGSSRRPVLVVGGGQFFVGPDNGLFSYIYEREPKARVFHLDREEYFRLPVSATFHGRDVFAPIAGALCNGVEFSELGHEIKDYIRLAPLAPGRDVDGNLDAEIIHIDRFGNCFTNLTRGDVTEEMIASGVRLIVCGHEIKTFRGFYAETGAAPGELFAIWGSMG
ncbi:MAG: SAM-dependent chlorinase/fluorinase, partial [Acidobacteria bacterium]|nr:SAM-dependent chlorinase/fluorinase [Acidobacteriota bacterium]